MSSLIVKELYKKYEKQEVLSGISFDANDGEFISILGSSGCGKTTLLRIIAGLEKCNHGRIYCDGVDITDMSPAGRNIGMVFQNYSLFPNMTVYENITYALNCKKTQAESRASDLVQEVIQKCSLETELKKYPFELSGGQQQRTAIARSLVMAPSILLLDEPFSALDSELRQSLRKLIKRFQLELQITIIYVTHDQEEAFTLSDRILIIRDGMVQQFGNPVDIFSNPSNIFVDNFIRVQLMERYDNLKRIVQPGNKEEYL